MPFIEIHIRPILDRVELDKAMDAHGKVQPTTTEEWARWWYRGGELWASFATIEGCPNGSTVHAYTKAKEKYALIGDLEMTQTCEDLIQAHAHWHESHNARTKKA